MNRAFPVDAVLRDVRYGVRVLGRTPAFALTAIGTLAIVIGANASVFSLADAILLRPLPYPEPERLAIVVAPVRSPRGDWIQESQDGATWELLRDQASSIEVALTASGFGAGVNLVAENAAVSVMQARVSAGYFHVVGVTPFMGREFTTDEDRPGGPAVSVLSYELWRRLFRDENAVGQRILLRGESYEVVGVMPESFESPRSGVDIWTPAGPATTGEGGGTNYQVIARLRDGRSWVEADGELAGLGEPFFKSRGLLAGASKWLSLAPLQDQLVANVREPLQMLAAAVATVLVIGCVNLAALLIARGGARSREIATRMALGCSRGAVVRQLLIESVLLGLAGGGLGLFVGYVGLESVKTLGGATFPEWTRVTLDGRTVAATAGASILTSLFFGLMPALQASRFHPGAALTDRSRTIAGGPRHWMRRVLVAAEVSLGMVLLTVTGLLVRNLVDLRSLDPGFDPSNLVTATVSLQDARYATAAAVNRLFDDTLAELQRTPGVESAAVSLELPYKRLLNSPFRFADEPASKDASIANFMYATPGFFETLRIPLRAGRLLSAGDRAGSPAVVVVNETFVRSWAQGVNPVGRRLMSGSVEREIVGVVGDVQVTNPGINFPGRIGGPLMTTPLVFLPAAQGGDGFFRQVHTWFTPTWSVRAAGSVNAIAAIQHAIARADPLLPVGGVRSMAAVQAAATAEERLLMTLVGVVAAVALLLAAIGLQGLIAHTVAERTREFGIRLALGATAGRTVRSVALSGMALAAAGAAAGIGASWVAARLVEASLWRVHPHDPLTYAIVAAFLLCVALVASVIPALKILRLDPAQTLRM
jgi:predicted permease